MENTKMTMDEFASYVKDHIFDAAPEMAESHTASINEVTKNNGMELTGLIIRSDDSPIAPTIYLEQFYDKFNDGADINDLMADIRGVYEEHKAPKNISVEFFTDFDQAKDRMAMKIINLDKNAEMLQNTPHFQYGDLAAIFQVQVDSNEFGNATITVKDEHMKMWGVTPQMLFEAAKENMEDRQPFRIQSMMEVMADMMGLDPMDLSEDMAPPMYVMSNESKINGAAAMIFTDKLQEFAEAHETNLFILPSSIHEILLIPESAEMNVQDLKDMVMQVNATEVSPEEVLSDNVYFYDKDSKQLMIAETKEPLVMVDPSKDKAPLEAEKPDKADKAKASEKAKPVKDDKPKSIKDKLAEGKAKVAAKDAEPKLPKDKVKHQEIN